MANYLETAILNAARVLLENPKLRHKDIMEWSSRRETVEAELKAETEVFIEVYTLGSTFFCAILKTGDNRKTETAPAIKPAKKTAKAKGKK